jgi:hypothetical protein
MSTNDESSVNTGIRFRRGMTLKGSGGDTQKNPKLRKRRGKGIFAIEGDGTHRQPAVGWSFDVDKRDHITWKMRREQVEVAKLIAQRNGFL